LGSLFCTTSTVVARHGFWKSFSSSAGSIILFQAVINTFLLLWVYEEYVKYRYFEAYLNEQAATFGWMLGVGAIILFLGSVPFVLVRRNKGVQLDVTGIEPLLAKSKLPSTPRVAAPFTNPNPINPTKPVESFHPVVAALKAELHGAPVLLGAPLVRAVPGAMTLQAPVQSFEDKTVRVQNTTPVLRIQGATPNPSQTTVATGQTPPSAIPSTVLTSAIAKKTEKDGPAEKQSSN